MLLGTLSDSSMPVLQLSIDDSVYNGQPAFFYTCPAGELAEV